MCQVMPTGCTLTTTKHTIKQILLICLWEGYFRIWLYFRQIKTVQSQQEVTTSHIKTKSNVQLICISFKFSKCLSCTKYVISRHSLGPQKSFTAHFSPNKHSNGPQLKIIWNLIKRIQKCWKWGFPFFWLTLYIWNVWYEDTGASFPDCQD